MEKEVELKAVEKDPTVLFGNFVDSVLSNGTIKEIEEDDPTAANEIEKMLVSLNNALKKGEAVREITRDFGCIMKFGVDKNRIKRQVVISINRNISTGKSRLEIMDNPDVYGRGQFDTFSLDTLWIDEDVKPTMIFLQKANYILKNKVPTKIKVILLDEVGNVYKGYFSLTRC